MQITLRIDGKDKIFVNEFVSFRKHYNAVKLNEEFQLRAHELTEQYDLLAEFVVITFDKQFTVDELLDGIQSLDELQTVFHECLAIGGLKVGNTKNDEGK